MTRRILHVIDHLGSGGAQTVLLYLLKYRDTTRFEYTVASLHGRGPMAAELESIGVRVVSLSAHKWPPGYLLALPRLLRSGQFDLVHFHLFGSNWIAKPIAWLMGCRALFSHDHCNDTMRDNTFFLMVDHFTNQLSTRILAVSISVTKFLRDRENIPDARLEYFPNGADVAAFPPATAEARKAARALWHLPPDAFLIGGVGRLVAQKDFSTFLGIAAQIHEQQPDVHFVIFGDGPEEAELKQKARSLGLENRVTFAGFVTGRTAIYAALDLLLLTSRYEGTPMVLLEAMLSQVPIVASAVDGTTEILRDGESALFFPPGDPGAGATALRTLLHDPAQRTRLADKARRDAIEHFNAEKQMKRLESLYDHALAL